MTTYRLSSSSGPGWGWWLGLRAWLEAHTSPPHWLPPRWQHPAIGYAVAASLTLIAASLTLLLEMIFPPLELQGMLLAVVVVLVALNWGEGPSLLVTVLVGLVLAFVALPPQFSWEIDDRAEAVSFCLFVLTGVLMNLIASQAGHARRKAEHLAQEADAARKHTEELADLLRQAHQHSEHEHHYLQQVLDVLPVGVSLVDTEGHLLQMNTAMRLLWDRKVPPAGEHIRTLDMGWSPTNGDSTSSQEGALTQVLRGSAAPKGQEVEMETIAGYRKTILHLAAPIQDEDGALLGSVVAEVDLTERKQLEERLRTAKSQMDAFVAIASHELKTPLTSLKLQTEATQRRLQHLIASETGTPAGKSEGLTSTQESLIRIRQHVGRLERLINDLVEMSRMQSGKLHLHLGPVDLAKLLGQIVEEQQVASARAILLHLPAQQPGPVVADGDRLGQVVTNYLSNALKYSPEEAPVEVGLEVETHQVRVWVHDVGPGIPSDEQERIWERFHRVPGISIQSRSGIGLGLGLFICREIIERHQGQVGVQSASGGGTTFWFTLPLASST